MLWLIMGLVLLAIAIAGGTIVHPVLFVLDVLALVMASRPSALEGTERGRTEHCSKGRSRSGLPQDRARATFGAMREPPGNGHVASARCAASSDGRYSFF